MYFKGPHNFINLEIKRVNEPRTDFWKDGQQFGTRSFRTLVWSIPRIPDSLNYIYLVVCSSERFTQYHLKNSCKKYIYIFHVTCSLFNCWCFIVFLTACLKPPSFIIIIFFKPLFIGQIRVGNISVKILHKSPSLKVIDVVASVKA